MSNSKIVKFVPWLFIGVIVDALMPVLSTVDEAAQQSASSNGFPPYSYYPIGILILIVFVAILIDHIDI